MSTSTVKHTKRTQPAFNHFAEMVRLQAPSAKRVPTPKRFRAQTEADPTMYSTLVEFGFIDNDAPTH